MTADRRPTTPRLRNGVIRRGSTWSYVIRVTDRRGVSKPKWVSGFPTEAAAKRARDEARSAASRGDFVDRSALTTEEYLWEWLENHSLEVKPRTRAGYEHLIRVYVAPRIGRTRLQALRPADLSALYRDLLESGGRGGKPLSARTVEYVHAVLRKAFNDATHSGSDTALSTSAAPRPTAGEVQRLVASSPARAKHRAQLSPSETGRPQPGGQPRSP